MKVGLFLRTFDGDVDWLYYCLRSITKYARGYYYLCVVHQPGSSRTWDQIDRWRREKGDRFLEQGCMQFEDNTGWAKLSCNGYLHQQVSKMRADMFMREEVDYICHIDSDCTFLEPNTPDIYFWDRMVPILLMTPYEVLPKDVPWQSPTSTALGEPVEFEFMRRFPMVYPRDLYEEARRFLLFKHNKTLSEFIASVGVFSEFNFLGAFFWMYHRDRFHWINTETDPFAPLPLKQYWSHGGVTPEFKEELEETIKNWNKD